MGVQQNTQVISAKAPRERHATGSSVAAALLVVFVVPGSRQDCGMAAAFMQPDGNAPKKATAVWADASGTALFFVESLNVNTDGTRRSYSVEDFWGEKTALNNLCNAMSDKCDGLDTTGMTNRRLVTQKAQAEGWPPELLKQTRISPSIVPMKAGKPCPTVDGFLVSATALRKPAASDVCDIANYVDALTVPALVIPGNPKNGVSDFAKRGANVGDLVIAMVPGGTNPVFAVVGDIGPASELGEGSVALNGKLLGKTAEPVNYNEVRGRKPFSGRGWVVPTALVLVFPATRDAKNPFMTTARIDEAAKKRFGDWGGIARLNTCAAEYARK